MDLYYVVVFFVRGNLHFKGSTFLFLLPFVVSQNKSITSKASLRLYYSGGWSPSFLDDFANDDDDRNDFFDYSDDVNDDVNDDECDIIPFTFHHSIEEEILDTREIPDERRRCRRRRRRRRRKTAVSTSARRRTKAPKAAEGQTKERRRREKTPPTSNTMRLCLLLLEVERRYSK